MKDRLILALDVDTPEEASSLMDRLGGYVGVFKVGMQLYTSVGPSILDLIHGGGGKVFLDLKFHDIPNTVAKAGIAAAGHGVFMFNVHTFGGLTMMAKAAEAVQNATSAQGLPKPLVLGVTVLTSIDQNMLTEEIGVDRPVADHVVHLAKMAQKAGLDGVVASPKEIKAIREACGSEFKLVIPGVRPDWASTDDQKRVMTPGEAIAAGADYLVVGRPITAAADPAGAARKIVDEMEAAV